MDSGWTWCVKVFDNVCDEHPQAREAQGERTVMTDYNGVRAVQSLREDQEAGGAERGLDEPRGSVATKLRLVLPCGCDQLGKCKSALMGLLTSCSCCTCA